MLKIAEKKTRWAIVLVILTVGVMFLAGCGAGNPVAKVDQPQGKVEIRPGSDGVFQTANHGTQIGAEGAVRTGADGETNVAFTDGVSVKLWPDSHFSITGKARIGRQESGSALFNIPSSPIERTIETPTGLTTIMGTVFAQEVTSSTFSLFLHEGKVSFTDNKGVTKMLTPGQQLLVKAGEPLPEPILMDEKLRKAIFQPKEFPYNKLASGTRPFSIQF